MSYVASLAPFVHQKLFVDSTEVTIARSAGYVYYDGFVDMRIPFTLDNDTEDIANGKIGTWTSSKTLKMQVRAYDATSYGAKLHQTYHWDGTGPSRQNVAATLRITAIA